VHSRYGFNRGFDYHVEGVKQLDDKSLDSLVELIEMNKSRPIFYFFHTYEIHDYYLDKPVFHKYVTNIFNKNEVRLVDLINLLGKPVWRQPRYEMISKQLMPPEGIRYVVDLYDGAIFCTDMMLGKFFDKLRDMGIYDEAWFIITSDHGEGLGDIHNNNRNSSWSHGRGLYENLIRIPLIIKPPKSLERDLSDERTMDEFVQTIDIAPTLLSIIGVSEREDFSGRSLLPLLLNGKKLDDVAIFSEELNTEEFSVIFDRYKLIRRPKSNFFADRNRFAFELYNLKDDQFEKVNVLEMEASSKYFPIRNELKKILDQHVDKVFNVGNLGNQPVREEKPNSKDVDAQQIKRLKELGYL
jgi:arylsulfatase A-like enzyme